MEIVGTVALSHTRVWTMSMGHHAGLLPCLQGKPSRKFESDHETVRLQLSQPYLAAHTHTLTRSKDKVTIRRNKEGFSWEIVAPFNSSSYNLGAALIHIRVYSD